MVDLEAQGLGNFPEWREKLRMALEKVSWVEAAVKDVKVALGDTNFLQKKHEDEITSIFDTSSMIQEGFLQRTRTVTERVGTMEVSIRMGFTYQGSS